jgi:hypothetical protein
MSPKETFVKPGRALQGANDLAAAGSSFYAKWTRLSGTITTLSSTTNPIWGNDEPGKKFAEQYVGDGNSGDGGSNVAQMTIDSTASIAPVLRDLGGDVKKAIQGTMDTDDLIDKWFPKE